MSAETVLRSVATRARGSTEPVLSALPDPILVIGADKRIAYVNAAAEQFFQATVRSSP